MDEKRYENVKDCLQVERSRFGSDILSALLISVLSVVVYSNTFHAPFVLDDYIYILRNPDITSLSNFWPPDGTRYTGYLSFAVNYRLGGYDVFGYHAFNIAVHIVNGLLVYALARLTLETPLIRSRTSGKYAQTIPLISALVFALHPVQTESVTYITQRFASLAALFYILSLVFYIKWRLGKGGARGKAFYAFALLAALAAMKSKEISFTLPVMLALFEFSFFSGPLRKRFVRIIPFFAAALTIPASFLLLKGAGSGVDERIMQLQNIELGKLSSYEYFISQFRVIAKYLRLIIYPVDQNLLYDLPFYRSILIPEVFFSFILLAVILASSILLYMKSRKNGSAFGLFASFGVFWFFVALSIESSVIPIQDIIYEHRLYLPLVGLSLAFSSACALVLEKAERPGISPLALRLILVIVFAAPLGAATYMRNNLWKDPFILWEDVAVKSPWSPLAHHNLGTEYFKKGMIDRSIEEFREAIRLAPDFDLPHKNLGAVYHGRGMFDEAIVEYKAVLKAHPDNPETLYNIGLVHMDKGMLDDALRHFEAALKADPGYVEGYYGLGEVNFRAGRTQESIRYFNAFIEAAPDVYLDFKRIAARRIEQAGE